MPSKKDPVFRKEIIPWYHSKTAYIIVVVLMLLVFVFALTGVLVATETSAYNDYLWVPLLLSLLSGCIFLTASYRLLKRYFARSNDPFLTK